MNDSSDDDELFGNDDQNDAAVEELERLNATAQPPDYTHTEEFQKFLDSNAINMNSKYGYFFIHLYKPFYFPGEVVRGSIILDLFNNLPKNYKRINIRFIGREYVGKHFSKVNRALKSLRKSTNAGGVDSISRRSDGSGSSMRVSKAGDIMDSKLPGDKLGMSERSEQKNKSEIGNLRHILSDQDQLGGSINRTVEAKLARVENPAELSGSQSNYKSNIGQIAKNQAANSGFLLRESTFQKINGSQRINGAEGSLKTLKEMSAGGGSFGLNLSNTIDMSKSMSFFQKERDSFIFIEQSALAFRFKSTGQVEKGQYRIPFIMRLPQRLPGTFKLTKNPKDKKEDVENFSIHYSIEVYIDGMRFEMFQDKEIVIKQFLFTEDEIDEDLGVQKRILQLHKLLDPENTGQVNINDIDKEELLKNIPKEVADSFKDQIFFDPSASMAQSQRPKNFEIQELSNEDSESNLNGGSHLSAPGKHNLALPGQHHLGQSDGQIVPTASPQNQTDSTQPQSQSAPKRVEFKAQKIGATQRGRHQSQFLQSQRIANMKQWKERHARNLEKEEEDQIKQQSIQGLTSQNFNFQSNIQSRGCFSCFSPQYNVQIHTNVDKVLYYPDEKIKIEMVVDNRQSQRKIQNIFCYLRQTVKLLKNKDDESKGYFFMQQFDLHRIRINKANFAEVLRRQVQDPNDRQRVYGSMLFEFDLEKIFMNLKALQAIEDSKKRLQAIQKKSNSKTQMSQVGEERSEGVIVKKQPGQLEPKEKKATAIGEDQLRASLTKPLPFQEDPKSAQEFEKQLLKFVDETKELTPLTINGISLVSEFAIAVRIEMEPIGLAGVLGGGTDGGEDAIPVLIRSRRDGNHIHDMMQLQVTELKQLSKEVEQMYSFIDRPFTLAGCDLGEVGKGEAKEEVEI